MDVKRISTIKLTIVGVSIALNIIGTLIAFSFKIPILMDSIGTIMISCLIGPMYGVITGICSCIISGVTFDIYSLYFAPVQIFVGLLSGIMFKWEFMKGKKRLLGVLFISIVSSFTGAVISAFTFNGITSSSSSYIVILLSSLGLNKIFSVFLVQVLMDYIDRLLAVSLVIPVLAALPVTLKQKLVRN
ncbi:integral membrane protein [Clostridium putrefaciens]|uniref:Integral membrane protein n=1 Tax=Clostridium putrefaciens TaxID=99675 RepID=A0A381J574_9CLOT|nr:ECF transporter S component [Clostridium putrefaciens]SUY46010.1 integral membrane protein [Clostridium putrefaciens]